MNVSPLALIDRLPARASLRGFTASLCGILGTLLVILISLWMYVDLVVAYSAGMYYQSSFETQAAAFQTFQSPYDLRMAVVFYNKTSGSVANHTALLNFFNSKMYAAVGSTNPLHLETTSACDPNYFADAVNPIKLPDCYIFTPNRAFPYTYQVSTSNPFSLVGLTFTYNCFNPFFCTSSGSAQLSVVGNLSNLFSNFSATFYFSTRVLQSNGSTQHQVYYISTGQFNTPATVTATFSAQIMVSNITMDYSIMPWVNSIFMSNLAWYGLKKGTSKTSTGSYSPLPKFDTIASNYQNLIFRYYKKEDWMLGVVGGGIFLIYFGFWILCHNFNRRLYRANAAEELLLEVNQTDSEHPTLEEAFRRPSIPYLYYFVPFYSNLAIDRVTEVLDITNIIRQLKIAQRNLKEKGGAKSDNKYKRINFEIQVPEEEEPRKQRSHKTSRMEEEDPPKKDKGLDESKSNLIPPLEGQDSLPFFNKQSEEEALDANLEVNSSHPRNLVKMDEEEQIEEKPQRVKQPVSPREREEFRPNLLDSHSKFVNQQDAGEKEDFQFRKISFLPFQPPQVKVEQPPERSIQSSQQPNKNQSEEKKSQEKGPQAQLRDSNERSSGEKMQLKSFSKKDEMKLSENEESNGIIMKFQQEMEPQNQEEKLCQRQADLLGMHPQSIKALKNSENTKQLFTNFLTVMRLTNNQEQFNELKENREYGSEPYQPAKTKGQLFKEKVANLFRLFDFYGVKIQLNSDYANHSWVGVLFTLIIIALPCLQLFNLLQLAGSSQAFVSKDFLQPWQINYNLVTGAGQSFRPAVCFSSLAYSYISGSYKTVQLLLYTYSASQGYTYYNPVNLASGQHSMLGISPDSLYSTIDTSTCFIFPDGTSIPMGGYNTANEAYFGFKITPYCTGTVQYCQDNAAYFNSDFFSFLSLTQGSFTFYTPINQYVQSKNSVLTGQVYGHSLREGTATFSATTSIEETLYLDHIQLIDSYSARFLTIKPVVLQESICTSRFQVGEVTKSLNTPSPYYEFRARPSGNLTKVILVGNTLYVVLGLIGGVFFLSYTVFHYFGKLYNSINVRLKLANQLYDQIGYNQPFIHKFCYFFGRVFCCHKCRYASMRMKSVNERIKEDLNAIEVVKTVYSIAKLSTIPYSSVIEKEMAAIPFKEKANDLFKGTEEGGKEQQEFEEDFDYEEDNVQMSRGNQIINESVTEKSKIKHEEGSSDGESVEEQDELDREYRIRKVREGIEFLPPTDPYRKEESIRRSKWREFFSIFDWFHSDTEFSLLGSWRVRSIFGCLCTLLSITILICVYFFVMLNSKDNYLISYDRSMLLDPDNTPPLQLNGSNFRLAVGFYRKPDFSFVDVSPYINFTVNSVIGVSAYLYKQTWINNSMVINETKVDLVPCGASYFDSFMSPNDDPSYYTSVINGFCLPSNISLYLTSNILNNTHYFKVSVYNKTIAAATSLQTLTSVYPMGVYMSIPVVNVQNQSFASQIQQIRPNSEVLNRAYEVNITLTRQMITFNNPNYTSFQVNPNTIETYNYIEDRAYERTNTFAATTLARVYNITFSHSGLRETHSVTYPSIPEMLGYTGGIIIVVIFVLGCIAQSFNNYYKEYLVGRSLYLYWSKKPSKKNRRNEGESLNENEQELTAFVENEEKAYFQKINNFTEWNVFQAWILSFPAALAHSYHWNDTLQKVHVLQQQARSDMDLFTFYKAMVQAKDAINANPRNRLSSNQDIPITNIYDKGLILKTSPHEYPRTERYFNQVRYHGLTSKEQWVLTRAGQREILLSDVFSQQYLRRTLLSYEPERGQQRSERGRVEMDMVRQSQSRKSNIIQPQEWIDIPLQPQQPQPEQPIPNPQERASEQNFQFNLQGQESSESED